MNDVLNFLISLGFYIEIEPFADDDGNTVRLSLYSKSQLERENSSDGCLCLTRGATVQSAALSVLVSGYVPQTTLNDSLQIALGVTEGI